MSLSDCVGQRSATALYRTLCNRVLWVTCWLHDVTIVTVIFIHVTQTRFFWLSPVHIVHSQPSVSAAAASCWHSLYRGVVFTGWVTVARQDIRNRSGLFLALLDSPPCGILLVWVTDWQAAENHDPSNRRPHPAAFCITPTEACFVIYPLQADCCYSHQQTLH